MIELKQALGLNSKDDPFPWQSSLYDRLIKGIGQHLVLDVPTGLGKTSVMAAWLVARSNGAYLPRRLVYVVDRRAVVDQATREAERLRHWVEGNAEFRKKLMLRNHQQLPISTLRGQFADNGQWLCDPSVPSIVVGTVDMVGSRLLFEGYGVSRKMRPFHAGFLGVDSLFVIDESHLVPPFEALLRQVVSANTELCGDADQSKLIPRSVLVSLSATGRAETGEVVTIDDRDVQHPIAGKRLRAIKRLKLIPPKDAEQDLADRLATEAWDLSDQGISNKRIIVFCNSRGTAMKVMQAVNKFAAGDKKAGIPSTSIATELFVGARRVRERQRLEKWLMKFGFLAGTQVERNTPAFVFTTSAGEVGVDLDADHMVGDLVAFERMVQRLGRVNRRGEGDAEVRIVLDRNVPDANEAVALKKALEKHPRDRGANEHELVRKFDLAPKFRAALELLPFIAESADRDARPEALRQLKLRSKDNAALAEVLSAATTPSPLRPKLTRPILDSWSMTSLEKHSARPFVAPWLRGWIEDEPQTTVVWRKYLPTQSSKCTDKQILEFFDAAPIHLTEKLETGSDDVFKWLLKRVDAIWKLRSKLSKNTSTDDSARLPNANDIVAILIDRFGEVARRLSLNDLRFDGDKIAKFAKKQFERDLADSTLVVDYRIGGLAKGLLDETAPETECAEAADSITAVEWMEISVAQTDAVIEPIPAFRISEVSADMLSVSNQKKTADRQWKVCLRQPIQSPEEDEPSSFLIVEKFGKSVTSEESRSTIGLRSLKDHHNDTEFEVLQITERLKLPYELKLAFRIAARNHDHGKNCSRWQNAFSAPHSKGPFAKTPGPFRNNYLEGYRHEFGSIPFVCDDPDFNNLTDDLKHLVLHLVAAHHGFARPTIRIDGCKDAPPSVLTNRARDVALRFARLQKQWGPWGLAWLESILRAADHRASEKIDDLDESDIVQDQERVAEVVHV